MKFEDMINVETVNNRITEQILASLDIVDIIGERVKLRTSGKDYWGLCPFHNETSASFHVYTESQSYYCFGCKEGGNIFNFLMKLDNLNFHEALEILAHRAGIKLDEYKHKSDKINYNEILEATVKFFTNNLLGIQGTSARAYLERRHLDKSDIERFSLGYGLDSWNSLVNYLRRIKVNDKQILDLGLAINGKHGLYDRFRGRLIFPIKNAMGTVVAFGGRLIDGEGAKYINSPESVVYSKRNNLYLLDKARNVIKAKERAILVEGYMDAVRLHKCGFNETIASLGTSLTEEQAKLLGRFTNKCYICYDSDAAGQKATIKTMYTLQKNGVTVHIVNLPDGKDPDEFLSTDGHTPQMFEEILEASKPLIVNHIDALGFSDMEDDDKRSTSKYLFDGISKLSAEEIVPYKYEISKATLVPPGKLEEIFAKRNPNAVDDNDIFNLLNNESLKSSESPLKDISNELLESAICSIMMHNQEYRAEININDVNRLFSTPITNEIAITFLTSDPINAYNLWSMLGDKEKISIIAQGEWFSSRNKFSTSEKWQKFYKELSDRYFDKRKDYLVKQLKKGIATNEELKEFSTYSTKWRKDLF